MLAKRIIPCLDVKDGQVVKGVQFNNHEIVGDIVELAQRYSHEGADELVFYDITASSTERTVSTAWISRVAQVIDIPFCVAGGIKSVAAAGEILAAGADKISINSPALQNPQLINDLAQHFGSQCVVVGIDSWRDDTNSKSFQVHKFTGDPDKMQQTNWDTLQWVEQVQQLGAGEIVLNVMNHDGVRRGYDIAQLQAVRSICRIPLIASGGAGTMQHFADVFKQAQVDGALAASVFHKQLINIKELKQYLAAQNIEVRI